MIKSRPICSQEERDFPLSEFITDVGSGAVESWNPPILRQHGRRRVGSEPLTVVSKGQRCLSVPFDVLQLVNDAPRDLRLGQHPVRSVVLSLRLG